MTNKDLQKYIETNTKLEIIRDILINLEYPQDDDLLNYTLQDLPQFISEAQDHCFNKIQED